MNRWTHRYKATWSTSTPRSASSYDEAGHHSGNSRNGTRTKTVHTDFGPTDIDVPKDRAGTFELQIVQTAAPDRG